MNTPPDPSGRYHPPASTATSPDKSVQTRWSKRSKFKRSMDCSKPGTVNWTVNGGRMFPSMCNMGHALPLVFTRFLCCARRRAKMRGCIAIRDGNVAIDSALNANRTCESSRQQGQSYLVTRCCVSAARCAAWVDSRPLPRP
jgi:hypothetical protein